MEIEIENYQGLISQIGSLLKEGRQKASHSVNFILVQTYWEIGKYIVEFEQKGNVRAEYGSKLFDRMSKDLTESYGKGFSRSNLLYMRKLYLNFQISETLSHKLTWSHYFEILKADRDLEIQFYVKQTEIMPFYKVAIKIEIPEFRFASSGMTCVHLNSVEGIYAYFCFKTIDLQKNIIKLCSQELSKT